MGWSLGGWVGSGVPWGWGFFRACLFPVCPLHRHFCGRQREFYRRWCSFSYLFGVFSLLFGFVYFLAMVRCLPYRVVMYAGVVRFLSDCFRWSRPLIPSYCCRRLPFCLFFFLYFSCWLIWVFIFVWTSLQWGPPPL